MEQSAVCEHLQSLPAQYREMGLLRIIPNHLICRIRNSANDQGSVVAGSIWTQLAGDFITGYQALLIIQLDRVIFGGLRRQGPMYSNHPAESRPVVDCVLNRVARLSDVTHALGVSALTMWYVPDDLSVTTATCIH